jgi:hypothetical protein
MPADFFPKRDADIVDWSSNFSAQINLPDAPTKYGVPVERAVEYASLQQTFESLYQLSQANSTRTPSIIAAKNEARRAMERSTRLLVRYIRGNPNLTIQHRVELGIPIRNPGGPRGRRWSQGLPEGPDHSPRLMVIDGRALRVRLVLRDRNAPMNLSLPKGVHGATIFYATGAPGSLPPALDDRGGWKLLCMTSRTVIDVAFEGSQGLSSGGGSVLKRGPALPPFTKVWLTAFWNDRAEYRSAWCEPVYTHLGYGLAKAA